MELYVVAESIDGPCKIGFADRLAHRLTNLQGGNPRELSLFYSQECEHYRHAEKIAHFQAGYKNRVRGEWFGVSVEAATIAVKRACYLAKRAADRQK